MSQQILQVDQAMLETTLDRMVRKSVEETLNAMPDASGRRDRRDVQIYERSGGRRAYRSPEPRHAPVWRHAGGSELVIVPWMAMTKSAQPFGNYRGRTFSWRLNEKIIICPAPRNDSARWTCIPPRR